jgi:hypothetical protein
MDLAQPAKIPQTHIVNATAANGEITVVVSNDTGSTADVNIYHG